MVRCEQCQERMLDFLYGLLDPSEEADLAAHLADCSACAAAKVDAARAQGLFAAAAKLPFPDVTFTPPADARPAALTPPAPTRRPWVSWAIAFGLLLAVGGGVGGPAVRDWLGFLANRPEVDRRLAAVEQAETEKRRRAEGQDAKVRAARDRVAEAQKAHDELAKEWVLASAAAATDRPLAVAVSGPVAAVPGAPNEYTFRTTDAAGNPVPARIEAMVATAAGTVIARTTLEPPIQRENVNAPLRPTRWRLPADLWAKLPAGADDLRLSVTATNPATGARAELAEPIRLTPPVHTTFLVTDKPLYRPGEPVFFRSVTLDRTKFLPPARDLTIRFELRKPDGQPLPGATVTGVTRPVTPKGEPVAGPDGKPVHGVASGIIRLPDDLPGGEYTLTAFELPPGGDEPAKDAVPLAMRKILVNRYTPEKLLKTLEFDARTYGPGDPVRANLTVTDQGKPVAGAKVSPIVAGGAELITPTGDTATDAVGRAVIRFTLPKAADLPPLTLSVQVDKDGETETIARPVPLATKKLSLEFFPEGGDLVEGVASRVYVRATTPAHAPADVRGYVTDGTRTVGEFQTLTDPDHPGANQGLGVFAFTPEPGKRYAVKLLRPVGVVEPPGGFRLPAAKPDGVVLSIPDGVTEPGQPIRATVVSGTAKRNLLVGAYTRGAAVAHQRVTAEPGEPAAVVLTPPAGAVGGVTRVTVFEEREGGKEPVPVAERLVFRRPPESLNLSVTANAATYTPGDKVRLDLAATNEKGEPAGAVLWVAVVNQSVLAMADDKAERPMPTHFLLAGEVQRPDRLEYADFLLTKHPKAAETLDLLLGTQGWRRFAEQTKRVLGVEKADADRFFAASGMGPAERTAADPVAEKYRPRYEAAADKLATAEQAAQNADAERRMANTAAAGEYYSTVLLFGDAAGRQDEFQDRARGRAAWMPILALIGVGLVSVRFALPRRRPERGPALLTGVGLLAVAALSLVADQTARSHSKDWRQTFDRLAAPEAAAGAENPPPAMPAAGGGGRLEVAMVEPGGPRLLESTQSSRRSSRPVVAGPASVPDPAAVTPSAAFAPGGLFTDVLDQRRQAGEESARRIEEELRRSRPDRRLGPAEREGLQRVKAAVARSGPFVVREYAHARRTPPPAVGPIDLHETDGTRADFTETVYWHPVLVLPADGKAGVEFQLSDSVTGYRVLAAGHALDGRLGAVTGRVEVRKPLAVDAKLPPEVGSSDRLTVPVTMANGTPLPAQASLWCWSDFCEVGGEQGRATVHLDGHAGARRLVALTPKATSGTARIRVSAAAGGGRADAVERTLKIVPDGFPVAGSASEMLEQTGRVRVAPPGQLVPGTLGVKLTVFTNALADLQSGLDGLLAEPHGCFEQTSSANYPNVLVLDYLKRTGRAAPATADRARGLLDRGYARLAGFEVAKKAADGREGFEWFGQYPPHEPLSAYGLIQFADMAKVFPVEPALIARTRDFLLAKRDGKGGFTCHPDGHTFGAVPDAVANAYIAWAITEADKSADVAKEVAAAAAEAKASGDPYRLALAANARLNCGEPADDLLQLLAEKQKPDGSVPGAETTITRSGGADLVTETTALAVLAWQKRPAAFAANARSAARWLVGRRGPHGAFGATQATVLALKALVEQARAAPKEPEGGELTVRVGGVVVGRTAFRTDDPGPVVIEFPNAEKLFAGGPAEVALETTAKQAYPFTVAWAARTRKPAASPACPLRLTTALDSPEVAEGRTVRLSARLENTTDTGHGMVVAVVGLPAGLKLPPDMRQLKELTANGVVSYWELNGRELVLYWRGLAPRQAIALALDLIADVPGEYRGPASRAYLYYTPDAKAWADPVMVRIQSAG